METQYRMFNPYEHLTQSFWLTQKQWEYVKAQLSECDLTNIENGGWARLGSCASVWHADKRAAAQAAR